MRGADISLRTSHDSGSKPRSAHRHLVPASAVHDADDYLLTQGAQSVGSVRADGGGGDGGGGDGEGKGGGGGHSGGDGGGASKEQSLWLFLGLSHCVGTLREW